MDNRTIEEVRKNETKLINEIKVLEQQYKKQKEVIDKIEKLITEYLGNNYSIYYENEIECELINDISNILKEVSE